MRRSRCRAAVEGTIDDVGWNALLADLDRDRRLAARARGVDVRHADERPEGWRFAAARDRADPGPLSPHRMTMPRDTRRVELESDQAALRAGGRLRARALPAVEAGLLKLPYPADPGLERRRLGIHVGAAERQPGFEPQGVASCEPARQPAMPPDCRQDGVPDRARLAGRDEELEAVLAGVAGPGHESADAGDGRFADGERAERGQIEWRQRPERVLGFGTLERQQRELGAAVLEDDVDGRAGGDPREIRLRRGGIHDQEKAIAVEAEHDQVVHDASSLVAQHRILSVARAEPADVVHGELLAQRLRSRSPQLDLAHLAHGEEPASRPDRAVLVEWTRVRHRHVPAGKLDDARAELAVRIEQNGAPRHAVTPPAPAPPPSQCSRAASRRSSDRRRPEPA